MVISHDLVILDRVWVYGALCAGVAVSVVRGYNALLDTHTYTKEMQMNYVDKIKSDFKEVVDLINSELGDGYAVRNPDLIRHLMDKVQQEEDRNLAKVLNQITT